MSQTAWSRYWFSLLLILPALAACTILPQPLEYDIYRLPPSTINASQGSTVDWSLRITRPDASDLLAGSRIAVMPDANRLIVYDAARWHSPVPVLWRDQLLDAFHNDGRVRKLGSDADSFRADFELGGLLRGFQAEVHGEQPQAVIQLDARLVDAGTQRIVATQRFDVSEPADSRQIPDIINAFGRASDKLATDIIGWTLKTVPRVEH